LSTSMSMWGSEKSSSKLTLFKSLKSTHTRILLHFLGTTAMFNTYWGYLSTSRKLVSHYFFISSFILIRMSNLILVSFCFTCLQPYIIGSLCTTILVSILVISTCFQANTSDNSFNKDTKSSLFLATIYIPILNSFFSCLVPISTIFIFSSMSFKAFSDCSIIYGNSAMSSSSNSFHP
jgi:hypothetical protein